jgi:hypothetical protein
LSGRETENSENVSRFSLAGAVEQSIMKVTTIVVWIGLIRGAFWGKLSASHRPDGASRQRVDFDAG